MSVKIGNDGIERCPRCFWPMAKTAAEGCTPGNCSMRPLPPLRVASPHNCPDDPFDGDQTIIRLREELAASKQIQAAEKKILLEEVSENARLTAQLSEARKCSDDFQRRFVICAILARDLYEYASSDEQQAALKSYADYALNGIEPKITEDWVPFFKPCPRCAEARKLADERGAALARIQALAHGEMYGPNERTALYDIWQETREYAKPSDAASEGQG